MKPLPLSILILLLYAIPVRADWYRYQWFDITKDPLLPTLKIENYYQVKRRKKAKHVFCGPYFKPSTLEVIDLTIYNYRQHHCYMYPWRRPVVCIDNKKIWIERPTRGQKKINKIVRFAVACDHRSTHRKKKIVRILLAVKRDKKSYCFVTVYGTEIYARYVMKHRVKCNNFVFLDNDMSTKKKAKMRVHFVVL